MRPAPGVTVSGHINKEFGATESSSGITSFYAGCSNITHYHNAEESVIVIEGEGILMINGEENRVRANDAALITPGTHHRLINTGETPFRVAAETGHAGNISTHWEIRATGDALPVARASCPDSPRMRIGSLLQYASTYGECRGQYGPSLWVEPALMQGVPSYEVYTYSNQYCPHYHHDHCHQRSRRRFSICCR